MCCCVGVRPWIVICASTSTNVMRYIKVWRCPFSTFMIAVTRNIFFFESHSFWRFNWSWDSRDSWKGLMCIILWKYSVRPQSFLSCCLTAVRQGDDSSLSLSPAHSLSFQSEHLSGGDCARKRGWNYFQPQPQLPLSVSSLFVYF